LDEKWMRIECSAPTFELRFMCHTMRDFNARSLEPYLMGTHFQTEKTKTLKNQIAGLV
jgi:hypothetical protein